MFSRLRQLLELIRFSHTVFALPFALLSAVLAWRIVPFRWRDLVGIVLCMVFARSVAMAANRIIDRRIDADNPRTAGRHLPAGTLSVRTVFVFAIACAAGFILSTLLFLPNPWPIELSVPVLVFLVAYSYTKRFTTWCHYWLGAALMLAPIATWIAICQELAWTPFLLAAVVFFWVGGFDILYGCQDRDFDRQHHLFSLPARWGIPAALRLAMFSHLATIVALFALWYVGELGYVFLSGVICVTALLVYEHWLVRPDDLTRINTAFFHVNALISVGLLLVGIADVWLTTWSGG